MCLHYPGLFIGAWQKGGESCWHSCPSQLPSWVWWGWSCAGPWEFLTWMELGLCGTPGSDTLWHKTASFKLLQFLLTNPQQKCGCDCADIVWPSRPLIIPTHKSVSHRAGWGSRGHAANTGAKLSSRAWLCPADTASSPSLGCYC